MVSSRPSSAASCRSWQRRWSATCCQTLLRRRNGYVVDKVEGFTIDPAGNAYVVTDNDGVDDSSGETLFLRLGKIEAMN